MLSVEGKNQTIFLSVAAYRDEDLWPTLEDCVASARHPERLHIAVLDQSASPAEEPSSLRDRIGHLSYLHLHHRYSRGPCWARHVITTYLRDEHYFLQIDSHMRFDEHWDDLLKQRLQEVSVENDRSILSTYPCAFDILEGKVVKRPLPGHVLALRTRPDAQLSEESPVLPFHAVPTVCNSALPGFHVGAGCLFSTARLIREVPIDPWLYFHGEEQNLAVRAWTHGWDIWHSADMPIYHRYHKGGERPVHWDSHDEQLRAIKWSTLNQQANERMRKLLYEGADLGAYGLGNKRSLEDFRSFSGIDYQNRSIHSPGLRRPELSASPGATPLKA